MVNVCPDFSMNTREPRNNIVATSTYVKVILIIVHSNKTMILKILKTLSDDDLSFF